MDPSREKAGVNMTPLESMLEKFVQVITADGRTFVGNLKGLDQALNAILSECEERIYSKSSGVKMEKLGLFVIRGDNIAIMGEIDEEIDSILDFTAIKADPLKPIQN